MYVLVLGQGQLTAHQDQAVSQTYPEPQTHIGPTKPRAHLAGFLQQQAVARFHGWLVQPRKYPSTTSGSSRRYPPGFCPRSTQWWLAP